MLLVRAIGFHWHAVQRDLLALGFRAADMFTPKLTAREVLSIVTASPSGSAVRYSFDGGWSLTDHLIATAHEQQLGLVQQQRFQRPGVTGPTRPSKPARIDNPNGAHILFDVVPLNEFRAKGNG